MLLTLYERAGQIVLVCQIHNSGKRSLCRMCIFGREKMPEFWLLQWIIRKPSCGCMWSMGRHNRAGAIPHLAKNIEWAIQCIFLWIRWSGFTKIIMMMMMYSHKNRRVQRVCWFLAFLATNDLDECGRLTQTRRLIGLASRVRLGSQSRAQQDPAQ